ncbi:MAG TPA: patatin-like phospholipase family protein [Chloroflexota bacterium]|jgi:hypothetical protein
MPVREILDATRPRKMLAIDGGGIRAMLSIEVLAQIERLARAAYANPLLTLADCFDYFAGTSTGAIVATLLSLGMTVDDIRDLYVRTGPLMFSHARLTERLRFRYDDEPLARMLKQRLGKGTTLGSDLVKTLLLLVLRDATTDSPWPISNNPGAPFNRLDSPTCNLRFPLWQLVRASTAAPLYFPPEVIEVGGQEHVFVDGGLTPFANPAFQLFLMSTVDRYNLRWPVGEDKMLLVSLGTGSSSGARAGLHPREMNLLYQAGAIPHALLSAANIEQDMLCRVFGRCRFGAMIDSEIGDLIGSLGPLQHKLFTYVRYDIELARPALDGLGLRHIEPSIFAHLDSIAGIPELQEVGRALATRVSGEHFAGFFPEVPVEPR